MKNQEINLFVRKSLTINAVIALGLTIILIIIGLYEWTLGYILGFITSCLTFIMHARNVEKMGVCIERPMKNALSSTMFRLFISAISLFIALMISWIDIMGTFIGLVIIKIVVIIVPLVSGNNKKRREC